MRWNCKICVIFHVWSQWKETNRLSIMRPVRIRLTPLSAWEERDSVEVGVCVQQERVCEKCGKIQLRKVKMYL